MSKWFMRSRTLWVNGLAAGGLVAAQTAAAGEVEALGLALVAPAGNGVVRFATSQALGSLGKPILKSKTVRLNVLFLIGAGIAVAAGQPELGLALGGLALINLWLRAVTDRKVTVFPHPRR